MNRRTGFLLPLLLISAVLMMIVPVSPTVMDLVLAANIALAVLVLMSVVLLRDNLEFSIFPSLLLVLTLTRLALNVSSTRLILLDGYAGKVIESFGNFVIGGSVVVGLVVFLILIVIQFAVVTNGAGRVAEVAARFTLDALPGKQMAIDADLNAGLIDEQQARAKRDRIAKEADFYGAMDGASKFVKGDVIAGVAIVLINLFGGLAVGIGQGLGAAEAIDTYARLTVGDGLVSQLPAILTSVSAGLLVTRVNGERNLGEEVAVQLFATGRALRLAAAVLAGMALLPGLPRVPFAVLAATMWILGSRLRTQTSAVDADTVEVEVTRSENDELLDELRVEPIELRLSYDLVELADEQVGGDLLARVGALRRQIARDLGFVMPPVRTIDDGSLDPNSYVVRLEGSDLGRGLAPRGQVLALPAGDGSELAGLGGQPTEEPVFGLPAVLIPDVAADQAAALGATVVDRSSMVVTHLAELVRRHADLLLGRQDVQRLVESLREDHPILAKDVDNDVVSLGALHRVLRGLLAEGVNIRHLARIVEALTERAADASFDEQLAVARTALGSSIASQLAPGGRLAVVTFEPASEAGLHEELRDVEGERRLVVDSATNDAIGSGVVSAMNSGATAGLPIAVVCGQHLRRPLYRLLQALGHDIAVVAYTELPGHLDLVPAGVVDLGQSTLSTPSVSSISSGTASPVTS